jgi:hypothetical protein
MSKAMSKMTKAELYAELKAARAGSTPTPKGTNGPKQKLVNRDGVECKSTYTLQYSNRIIGRHVDTPSLCGCDPERGFRCKAVKRYGHTYADRGQVQA